MSMLLSPAGQWIRNTFMRMKMPLPLQSRAPAAARLAQSPASEVSARSDTELLCELQLRQLELEKQNEILHKTRSVVAESRDKYVELYDFAPVGYATITDNGLIDEINLAGAALLGAERNKILQHRFSSFVMPDYADRYRTHFFGVLKTAEKLTCELALLRVDGSHVHVRLDSLQVIKDGQTRALRVALIDISEHKQIEAALKESEERWGFAIEGAGDGSWDWNVQTGATFYSPRYKEMFGYVDADFGTTSDEWSKRIHPDDAPGAFAGLQPYMDGKPGSVAVEFRMLCNDGSWKWTLCRGMVVSRDADGKPLRMIGTTADITERKQAEDKIWTLAFYDPLTRLPNRRLLNDRISQVLATCTRSGCYGALMFLDLDNFKPLNDTHGHVAGDLLLIEVAERLRNNVRGIDTVSRFGGDEFVVVINGLNEDSAESTVQAEFIAEKIRRTLSEPYHLAVKHVDRTDAVIEHHCTVSVGVVLFVGHKASRDDILSWADIAMYQAKEAGRNRVRFFDAQT